MEVVDVLFLITVSVYPCQRFIAAFIGIQIQALPFVCAAFLNHLQPVPQEAGTVVGLAFAVYLMFFDTPAKGVVDVAVTLTAACLLNAYFAQAVVGVVVVVLGCADGLFAGSSAVLVVAVVVSSEMQELVTANQVLAAFDSAGDIVFLNYISTINFFSLLISLINRGISCRACAINS